jgi:hypothetical protein
MASSERASLSQATVDGSDPAALVQVDPQNLPATPATLPGEASGAPAAFESLASTRPAEVSSLDIARSWEAAGDWLSDLVKIEAGEAAELARRLAPALFAAGICLAWGNALHTSRTPGRDEDDEFATATLCPGR